jgi:hypothetical protein
MDAQNRAGDMAAMVMVAASHARVRPDRSIEDSRHDIESQVGKTIGSIVGCSMPLDEARPDIIAAVIGTMHQTDRATTMMVTHSF